MIANKASAQFKLVGSLALTGIPPKSPLYSAKVQELAFDRYATLSKKLRPLLQELESRAGAEDFNKVLQGCVTSYRFERTNLMKGLIEANCDLEEEEEKQSVMQTIWSGAGYLLSVCEKEFDVFSQFFSLHPEGFTLMMDEMVAFLYERIRPDVIGMSEVKALCDAIRGVQDVLTSQILPQGFKAKSLVNLFGLLKADLQERLIFCVALGLDRKAEVHPRDVDYPALLEANPDTWYPSLASTLELLSDIVHCVESATFSDLASMAIRKCASSFLDASNAMAASQSNKDLFLVKHLLLLMEEVQPFNLSASGSTVTERTLDYSSTSGALHKFVLTHPLVYFQQRNPIMKALREGLPEVKEVVVDAKREVEDLLMERIQHFVTITVDLVLDQVQEFMLKQESFKDDFLKQDFASEERVKGVLATATLSVPKYMQQAWTLAALYLGDTQTKDILLNSVYTDVYEMVLKLEAVLEAHYSKELVQEVLLLKDSVSKYLV